MATRGGQSEAIAFNNLLESLDGIAYVVARDGRIIAAGTRAWAEFAAAAKVEVPSCVGTNLFTAIEGEQVRDIYLELHDAVWNGRRRIAVTLRCDAPEVRRDLRLAVSPIVTEAGTIALLYQSQVLSEQLRPPMRFLAPGDAIDRMVRDQAPILQVCSFCAKVARDAGPWLSAEQYYHEGGISEVRLSHGVCPPCLAEARAHVYERR